jgi:hypothetical protein
MKNKSVIEEHRLEWENIVIDLINRGWTKSEAQNEADTRIELEYEEE